jgi:nucleotide-binding universal stress UspA family protein
MGTRILVPLDGSELADAAVPYAERIGKALGWSAILFCAVAVDRSSLPRHVPTPPPPAESGPGVLEAWDRLEATADDELRDEIAAARDALAPAATRLRAAGLEAAVEVAVGEATDAIARRADRDDIAMVVMASHGRTGLRRLLRGSVAAGVARNSDCPTLVVNAFREGDQRYVLEHAERLSSGEAEAVRQAVGAPLG